MENKAQKKVLMIIGVVLVFIALIAILLSLLVEEEKSPSSNENPNSNNISGDRINKEISRLNNDIEFFTVQKVINEYYDLVSNSNSDKVYALLETGYINENNITKENVMQKINNDYAISTYYANEIYYNDNSSTTYYFVQGSYSGTVMTEDDSNYKKSINYLIIVDADNHYCIKPLDSGINIESYAKNYKLESVTLDNDTKLSSYNIDIETKLTVYIAKFLELIIIDTETAYNMLNEETKSYYGSFDNFNNQVFDIYEKYTSKIFSYHEGEEDGKKVYHVIDNKQNRITIYEDYVMDYKIGFTDN